MSLLQSAFADRHPAIFAPPSKRLRAVLGAVYLGVGGLVVHSARATPSLEWMKLYTLEDFRGLSDVGVFLGELHTGIPPLLAFLEIVSYLATGGSGLTSVVLYQLTLLIAFGLPFLVFPRTTLECGLSFVLCLVFLTATRVVTAPNPLVYDALLPALVLGFVAVIEVARRRPEGAGTTLLLGLGGLLLASAELTRPFALLLLPVLLLYAGLALGGLKRPLVAVLVPVVLLSGGWHLKLLVAHEGQLLWSSHGGFNLYRLWKQEIDEWPSFTKTPHWWRGSPEPTRLRGSGEWRSLQLNTANHAERSVALSRTVVAHVLTHPLSSAQLVGGQTLTLLRPRTSLLRQDPKGPVILVYRALTPLAGAWFGVNALLLASLGLRRSGRTVFARPETALLLCGWLCIGFLSMGESGEEARLVVSVLPFMAALPRIAFGPASEGPGSPPGESSGRGLWDPVRRSRKIPDE